MSTPACNLYFSQNNAPDIPTTVVNTAPLQAQATTTTGEMTDYPLVQATLVPIDDTKATTTSFPEAKLEDFGVPYFSSALPSPATTRRAAATTTPPASAQTVRTTNSKQRMKQERVRQQYRAGIVGAVVGLVVLGPVGAVIGGVCANKTTKAVMKSKEKRILHHQQQQRRQLAMQDTVEC